MAEIIKFPGQYAHKRWRLILTYLTEAGEINKEFYIEELEEAHDIVERGPDWNALICGRFELNPERRSYTVTVEESLEL